MKIATADRRAAGALISVGCRGAAWVTSPGFRSAQALCECLKVQSSLQPPPPAGDHVKARGSPPPAHSPHVRGLLSVPVPLPFSGTS